MPIAGPYTAPGGSPGRNRSGAEGVRRRPRPLRFPGRHRGDVQLEGHRACAPEPLPALDHLALQRRAAGVVEVRDHARQRRARRVLPVEELGGWRQAQRPCELPQPALSARARREASGKGDRRALRRIARRRKTVGGRERPSVEPALRRRPDQPTPAEPRMGRDRSEHSPSSPADAAPVAAVDRGRHHRGVRRPRRRRPRASAHQDPGAGQTMRPQRAVGTAVAHAPRRPGKGGG